MTHAVEDVPDDRGEQFSVEQLEEFLVGLERHGVFLGGEGGPGSH